MIKNILIATAAALVAVTPSFARVEAGTKSLLEAVDESGIVVQIDTQECIDEPGFYGWYRFSGMRRQLVLCPGDNVTAEDHDTVRHEAWHAIQHCINTARGTDVNMPIQPDHAKLLEQARGILSARTIEGIKSLYPEDEWLLEIEAAAAAEALTAEDIENLFRKACLY